MVELGSAETNEIMEVLLHNVQSLCNKIDELRIILEERRSDIMVAVETWLDSSHKDAEVAINNYNVFRRDRSTNPNRGGVAVYIRNGIMVTQLAMNPHPGECKCENIWLKINMGIKRTLILGAIYRGHQNRTFTEHLKLDMESVVTMKHPILLAGDFNYDLARMNKEAEDYYRNMNSFLLEQLVGAPTRITGTTATLIDHLWFSEEQLVVDCDTLQGLSDHEICYLQLRLYSRKDRGTNFKTRSLKHFNLPQYLHDLKGIDWGFIERWDDMDKIWEKWLKELTTVLDKHAPIRIIKPGRKSNNPWITKEIKDMVLEKLIARRAKDIVHSRKTVSRFNNVNNTVKKKIEEAKQTHYKSKVIENKDNSQKLWRILREIAPSNLNIKEQPIAVDLSAEAFNDYFVNIGVEIQEQINTMQGDTDITSTKAIDGATLMIAPTTVEKVQQVLKRIPTNKAPGYDGIPVKALIYGAPELLGPLTRLINRTIETEQIPRGLKHAEVTPIFKAGDRLNPKDYRPISVLPLVSKVLERIIADQLVEYLESNGMLSTAQHAFRRYHSTSTCLLQLTEQIRESMDSRKATGVIALDLSKAFDTIDHGTLLRKLNNFGILDGTPTHNLLRNYLSGRTQAVKLNGAWSSSRSIRTGVPQGSILGPLLFILYVNDLPDCIRHSNCVTYADDTTVFASSSISKNIEFALNEDMRRVCAWFQANRLKVNVDKTKFIVIHPLRMEDKFSNINVFVNGKLIGRESTMKILGVHFDEHLKWSHHVGILRRNVKFQYRALARAMKYFDLDTKLMMYNASIASRLNYADCIWNNCCRSDAAMLQTIQNMAVRRMINAGPRQTSGPILKDLGMLTLEDKRLQRSLVLLYKLMNDQGPEILICELDKYRNPRTEAETRHSAGGRLFIPGFNTDYRGKSFFISTIRNWNRLPEKIRNAHSCESFKSSILKMLLTTDLAAGRWEVPVSGAVQRIRR